MRDQYLMATTYLLALAIIIAAWGILGMNQQSRTQDMLCEMAQHQTIDLEQCEVTE